MTRTRLVWLLLGLWLALFLWSLPAARGTEPTGDSFVRGMNRVGVFMGWQLAALIPGIAAYAASRPLPPGALRRMACVPPGLLAAFIVFVLGLMVWARLSILIHQPEPYTAPVTAPAEKPPAPTD